MKTNTQGIGVALVTPFGADGSVDYESLGGLVDHVVSNGVDYLVMLGTTAETPTLTRPEQQQIAAFIRERNAGRLPLVLGIGGNSTSAVTDCIRKTDFTDVAALLSVTPYYNRPSQQGLYEHYKAIAEASPVPVLLYNVPGRTGVNLTAETTLRLAHEVPNILGVKEACGSLSQMCYLLRDRPEGFLVISGDDNMALPLIAHGGDGVISVAANAFPAECSAMVHAAMQGDWKKSAAIHLQLLEVVDALFAEGNPTGIKTALAAKRMIKNHLRLPLVPGSDKLFTHIEKLIRQYNL